MQQWKKGQIDEEEVVPESMPTLEDASIYVELGEKCNTYMQSEMLETMRILREELENLKAYSLKLMNSKSYQEEINKLLLKNFDRPIKEQWPKILQYQEEKKRRSTKWKQ